MAEQSNDTSMRRRVRFLPPDPEHFNYGKTGWGYPPGTYDPANLIEDGDSWTFEPDDRDALPNFADPKDFADPTAE